MYNENVGSPKKVDSEILEMVSKLDTGYKGGGLWDSQLIFFLIYKSVKIYFKPCKFYIISLLKRIVYNYNVKNELVLGFMSKISIYFILKQSLLGYFLHYKTIFLSFPFFLIISMKYYENFWSKMLTEHQPWWNIKRTHVR